MATQDNAVRLHRVLNAPPERVYRAFLDAAALSKWMPPDGFTCTVHELDAKVGGRYRMTFANFTSGNGHSFGGTYLELVPGEKIRYTDTLEEPNPYGEEITTVTLRAVPCGTEVRIVQQGSSETDPSPAHYLGWQQSLALLGQLVEAKIPDNS